MQKSFLIENTVKIPKKCVTELWKRQRALGEDWWSCEDDIRNKNGTLYFNSDFSEHMDVLSSSSSPEICEILQKHKVKGTIKFASVKDYDIGQFWGYQFDGKGGVRYLRGRIEWELVP